MTAYYNEIDPEAAQWLRNLIARGLIAPGDVDERSIEDVRPADLRGYTQCHFFAGIGVWSLALRRAGWPDDRPVWTGSCPCQPFSSAGKGGGFDDERHLWPAFHWLIEQCAPPIVFGEQVASKAVDEWIDLVQADLEAVGYAFGCVPFPSAGVGAPHIRDRSFWVGDTDRARLEGHAGYGGAARGQGTPGPVAEAGILGGLADDDYCGRHPRGEGRQARGYRPSAEPDRCDGWLADDSLGRRREECQDSRRHPSRDRAEGVPTGRVSGGPTRRLADADGCEHRNGELQPGGQFGFQSQDGSDGGQAGRGARAELAGGLERTGPTNSYWRDADWLFCRDGKWRPVEPGTFPLVNGAAARVVRLRAYGNAINAKAAQVFIESWLGARSADLDDLI